MGEVPSGAAILAGPISSEACDLSLNEETPIDCSSRDGNSSPGIAFEFKKPLPVGPKKEKLTFAKSKSADLTCGKKWERGKTKLNSKSDPSSGRKVKHGRPKFGKSKSAEASCGKKFKKLMARMTNKTSPYDAIFKFEAGWFFAHELWCGDLNYIREWLKMFNLPGRKKSLASRNKQLCIAARELTLLHQKLRLACSEATRDASIEFNFPISVPYKEPSWSGLPTSAYALEVFKSGKCTKEIDLSNKSCYVIGRCPSCDIITVNPTVSSLHCVLQFRIYGDDENPLGYYLCDLGSKYGTYLNKTRLKPNMFVRVQVGDLIKLGLSRTKYLLQGPSSEEEDKLKEIKVQKNRLQDASGEDFIENMLEPTQEGTQEMKEEVGIDWACPWNCTANIEDCSYL